MQTCGKGLAERSVLPAQMADVIAAMAANLEQHRASIPADSDEMEAYTQLATRYRAVAEDLGATAEQMESYRTLPNAKHDIAVLMSANNVASFGRFVEAERRLARTLGDFIQRDVEMLEQMSRPSRNV